MDVVVVDHLVVHSDRATIVENESRRAAARAAGVLIPTHSGRINVQAACSDRCGRSNAPLAEWAAATIAEVLDDVERRVGAHVHAGLGPVAAIAAARALSHEDFAKLCVNTDCVHLLSFVRRYVIIISSLETAGLASAGDLRQKVVVQKIGFGGCELVEVGHTARDVESRLRWNVLVVHSRVVLCGE